MVKACCVKGCKSESYANCGISFHRFPRIESLRAKWFSALGCDRITSKVPVVCSRHFKIQDFKSTILPTLNYDAVPSIINTSSNSAGVITVPGTVTLQPLSTSLNTSFTHAGVTAPRLGTVALNALSTSLEIMSTEKPKSPALEECRACLKKFETDQLYNLFQAWTSAWEGMKNTIAEDLSVIANVQIKEMDHHSKSICSSCCSDLQNACKFKLLVQTNDKLLRQRHPDTDNQVCNEKEWPQPIQLESSITGLYNNPLQVEIKQEVLTDDENMGNGEEGYTVTNCIDMIKIEPEEIAEPVTSVTPSFRVTQINGQECLEEEDETSMDFDPVQEEEIGTKQLAPLTHADVMEAVVEALSKPVEYIQTVKEEPLSEPEDSESATDLPMDCLLCARSFNSVSGLKAHVIAQHSYQTVERKAGDASPHRTQNNKYVCATCRRTFVTSTDLMVHETCHNKQICYGCSAKFDTFGELTKHRRLCKALSSPGVKRLKTLEDVKRPQQENSIVTEIKIEINNVTTLADSNETLSCAQCNEVFSDPYYMKIHQEVHHTKEEALEMKSGSVPMEIEALESIFNEET